MLKHLGGRAKLLTPSVFLISSSTCSSSLCTSVKIRSAIEALKLRSEGVLRIRCRARRRVRYEAEDEREEGEYGHNAEIAMLEMYSQSARGEALLVDAEVDEQDVKVLIFKGFSSCLSYGTSPDPSKSILPARAVIKSIDRIRGPFNPSNIEYIEKGLTWDAFKTRLQSN